MKGHIRQRGRESWELKFDVSGAAGERETKYHSFKGTKREAQKRLAELIASAGRGDYVPATKITVGKFVAARIDQWESAGNLTARTAQRYRQLLANQIVPHIGNNVLQRLTRLDVEDWHATLRAGGLAPRSIVHAHRLLGQAVADAEKDGIVVKNVCKLQRAPKVAEREMVIVHDVRGFIAKIEGERLGPLAVLAITTGMRLGEILAVREGRVMLDKGVIQVREALEETAAKGIIFKSPKSKAGRRDITLPDITITALREHRRELLELRMRLGAGRLGQDDLLFCNPDGSPLRPSAQSTAWGRLAERIGMPEVTFHALRHTHASQLIDRNVDPVTIAERLGHAKPDITLRIYAHLFKQDDSKAAAAINAALK